ncbi:MAG: radical SAM protein [Rhodocyclaceae bacterium]|nr:radical SAM protein [Rhodocyclaceae bacterium]
MGRPRGCPFYTPIQTLNFLSSFDEDNVRRTGRPDPHKSIDLGRHFMHDYPPRSSATAIEAVIKITERCNINCSYCYMFNKGNDDYLNHPIYIELETMRDIAKFLRNGAVELGASRVLVDFHGGEPLMLKPDRFDALCTLFREEIEPVARLALAVQTNGMLINEEWIRLFSKHKVGAGVSIDGPQEYNDLERIDHRGEGTYEATVAGVKQLQRAASVGLIKPPGALCVINPQHDPRRIYRHLVDDLGFVSINFIFPIDSHDSFDISTSEAYGTYLCELFDEWVSDDNPKIDIRVISELLAFLVSGNARVQHLDKLRGGAHQLITIASNGDLGPDDCLKPLNFGCDKVYNAQTSSLKQFVNSPAMLYFAHLENALPDECNDCCWQNFCRAGAAHGRLVNRFKKTTGFNNPSVVCSGLKEFYSHVAAHLVNEGVDEDLLLSALSPNSKLIPFSTVPPPPPEVFAKPNVLSPIVFSRKQTQ